MSRSRAVRSGFSSIFAQPSLYFGEAMWRAVFLLTAWALAIFALQQVLDSLPVSRLDAFGLSGAVPPLFPMAVRHIFSGTGPLMFRTVALLIILIAALWWVASSLGRIALLPSMIGSAGAGGTVAGLHLVRALFAAATALAYLGILLLELRVSALSGDRALAFAIVSAAVFSLVWSSISWYLTLAPILAVRDHLSALAAFKASASLARMAAVQFTWIAFVFWFFRFIVAAIALSLLFGMAAIASGLPPFTLIAAIAIAAVFYSLLSFLLHAARLAAYVRVVDWSFEETPIR